MTMVSVWLRAVSELPVLNHLRCLVGIGVVGGQPTARIYQAQGGVGVPLPAPQHRGPRQISSPARGTHPPAAGPWPPQQPPTPGSSLPSAAPLASPACSAQF